MENKMKTVHPLIVLACGLLCNPPAFAEVYQLSGPATVNITDLGQDYGGGGRTNIVGSTTNSTYLFKSFFTTTNLTAGWLLNLLTNSYNTNFPAGAKLLLRGSSGYYSFAVSDSTGTNVFMYTDPILSSEQQGLINTGVLTRSTTNQTSFTGNDTETFTAAITFEYDDYGWITADGTHNHFTISCLVESKQSRNLGTGSATENVTMNLTGGGYNGVFTGTIRATLTGSMPYE